MSDQYDLNPRLISVAILLSRHEEDSGNQLSVREIERHAKALGVRKKSLLALLGWLPLAKMDPRRGRLPKCVGEYKHKWAHGWDSNLAMSNVAVDLADREQFLSWTWCKVMHETPPLFTVYTFDSSCPLPVKPDAAARYQRH